MIRTRDLAALICFVFLGIMLYSIYFAISSPEETTGVATEPAVFLAPHEAYDVAPYTGDDARGSREAFIEKVRQSYTPPPKPEPQAEEVEEEISTPIIIESPFVPAEETVVPITPSIATQTPTSSETHGNTSL